MMKEGEEVLMPFNNLYCKIKTIRNKIIRLII
jgi:hypothetical protein